MVNTVRSVKVGFWQLKTLSWWIATLFMVGSSFFIIACTLYLLKGSNEFSIGLIFFIGSLFFTSAAYCQFYQAINAQSSCRVWFAWQPKQLVFSIACSQFIGTILFNVNTLDALLSLGWFKQELLVWVPDAIGSILFQISGSLALIDVQKRVEKSRAPKLDWGIGFINFIGCVAFLVSACFAIVLPHPIELLSSYATILTLIGAICFFLSAYLNWFQLMTSNKFQQR